MLVRNFFIFCRVKTSLKNFDEFGKTFNCKKGISKMYPVESEKCGSW